MNERFSKGTWSLGKLGASVITNDGTDFPKNTGHDDTKYYGGYLIAESIAKEADQNLISAAPDLYDAAKDALDLLDRRLGAADGSLYTSEIAKLKAALLKANPIV